MWKKTVAETSELSVTSRGPVMGAQDKDRALIGPSITFTGTLSGEEDVVIQGRIEGSVEFKGYSVTVGKHGRIKADIRAREVNVEGELEGNIFGEERVELCTTAKVKGNIEAPRVIMQDGALFKGSIDMSNRPAVKQSQHTDALARMPGNAADMNKIKVGQETASKKAV